MKSFAEFEATFLSALAQERSELRDLQVSPEAQLSGWIEHLFRDYLGYLWKEFARETGTPIGSRGGKQLFPDLRIDILDTGLIFIECKRPGRLDGPKSQEELDDGVGQLRSYIRAHLDRAGTKPKTVLGIVTDGNRWFLMGLNKTNEFHTIAEWAFLTDDPQLLAQRFWLLAKPALAQPTSALVEFLARRTLASVLKENAKWLTKKVNEKLPDGAVSEEMIAKWIREAFSDPVVPPRMVPADSSPPAVSTLSVPLSPGGTDASEVSSAAEEVESISRRIGVHDLLHAGLLLPDDVLLAEGADGRMQTATLTLEGKINVAGQLFDSVSLAALRAGELAGRLRKSVNGWVAFRVLRAGNLIGTLLDIRNQYEDSEQGALPIGQSLEAESQAEEGPEPAVTNAVAQLKPLLDLLPDLILNTSKSMISLYAGKLLVGYVFPRKRGLPRLRIYVGDVCPDWATPHPTDAAWCHVEDWSANQEQVIALLKEAPRRRAEDMANGRDVYRRRSAPSINSASLSSEP